MTYLNVHGLKCKLSSRQQDLSKLLEDSFPTFKVGSVDSPQLDIEIDIEKEVDFTSTVSGLNKIGNFEYTDGKSKLICAFAYYVFEFKFSNDRLFLKISSLKRHGIYSSLRAFARKKFKGEDYFFILRHAVVLPILWGLAHFKNIHCLHGGAVSKKNKALVFAGLAGSGKSTLSIYACMDKGYSFISDNYLLFDESHVYSFPEWIRVTNKTQSMIPSIGSSLKDKSTIERYGKKYFHLNSEKIAEKAEVSKFYICSLGEKTEISCISTSSVIDITQTSDAYVRELFQNSPVGLLDYTALGKETSKRFSWLNSLKQLVDKSSAGFLTISKNISLGESLSQLEGDN